MPSTPAQIATYATALIAALTVSGPYGSLDVEAWFETGSHVQPGWRCRDG